MVIGILYKIILYTHLCVYIIKDLILNHSMRERTASKKQIP